MRENLSIEELRMAYESQLRQGVENEIKFYEGKYQDFQARFTYFETENRHVSKWVQF